MATHLCLDFGTAYCKAATCSAGQPPRPLAIGQAVKQDQGDIHMIRTALFISEAGTVFFGEAAVDTANSAGRTPFDAIKNILTAAEDARELDEVLPTKYNPTNTTVTKRHIVMLYLAFFTQAALRAPDGPERNTRRSIAIPVFSPDKTKWVSTFLAESLGHAHVLADHFGNELFKSVELADAIHILDADQRNVPVAADPATVAEPVAAVAAQLLHFTPTGRKPPGLIMVVDVGAGTTDMAMFASGQVDDIVTVRHVANSKRSIMVAGKAIDGALVSHVVCKSGLSGGSEDLLRAKLLAESQGQLMKEEIFRDGQVERFEITTSLEDFLESVEMREVVETITEGFENVLMEVDRSFFARIVAVRFSGGGAFLPFLDRLVQRERYLRDGPKDHGKSLRMEIATREPQWRNEPQYRSLYRQISAKFHRMAVALGGAYYGAEGRSWLKLENDIPWLGSKQSPIRSQRDSDGRHDDAGPK